MITIQQLTLSLYRGLAKNGIVVDTNDSGGILGANEGGYVQIHDAIVLKKLDTDIDCLRVLIHEIAHATGAKHRLNRPAVAMAPSDLGAHASYFYAIEEVIADTAAGLVLEYYGLASNSISLKIDLYLNMHITRAKLNEFAIAQAKRDAVGAFNYIIEHFASSIAELENSVKVNG